MIEWITKNYEWIFSGAGVFIVSTIAAIIFSKKSKRDQSQIVGSHSTAQQAGRDIINKQ